MLALYSIFDANKILYTETGLFRFQNVFGGWILWILHNVNKDDISVQIAYAAILLCSLQSIHPSGEALTTAAAGTGIQT